jgi:hypothetical protein
MDSPLGFLRIAETCQVLPCDTRTCPIHISDNEVRRSLAIPFKTQQAIRGFEDFVAIAFERGTKERTDGFLSINDEYGGHGCRSLTAQPGLPRSVDDFL